MTTPAYFYIVWPERRHVPETQIMLWYEDAIANGEVDGTAINPTDMARELHREGLITLAHQ